jgi:hypothetical protein
VTELADGQSIQSVHTLIVGVKGSQLRFAGIGRPPQPNPLNLAEDKDSDFLYLKPMFSNMLAEGNTLFDLRGMRKNLKTMGPIDPEMERMIYGYDFVLIPSPKPSQAIQ